MWATPRTDRPTHGDRVGRVAVELGTPLMEWQQYVADVALEYDPDSGLPAYKSVTVTIPRQNGKTQLILSVMVARALVWGSKQGVVYGAQNGKDARKKWKEDLLPQLEGSPLGQLIKRAYLSDGNTNCLFHNQSRISIVDNTPTAGHGLTLDLVMLDEAFSHKDDAPETAFVPTMSTRPFAQLWNVSTAGDASSTYLLRKIDQGRAAVRAGKTEDTAYFEWAVPEDEDPYDMEILENRFPAFGVTIDEEFIQWAQGELSDGSYRRTIGNQWTKTEERMIPPEWWQAVSSPKVRCGDPVVYAIDARADRSQAAIAKADADGNVELVTVRPGVGWLFETLQDKLDTNMKIVLDGNGPLATVADDLERVWMNVERLDSMQVRKACGRFYDAIADQKTRVRSHELLDQAVENATTKTTADAWKWHRDAPGAETLMAVSLAYDMGIAHTEMEPVAAWL